MSPEQHPAMFDAELDPSDKRYTPHQDIIPILPILPLIQREARHDEEVPSKVSEKTRGCVYARGLALYPNSPNVMVRRVELQRGMGQGTDMGNTDRDIYNRPAKLTPAVQTDGPNDRDNGQRTSFANDGSSVRQHSPEAGLARYPNSQFHTTEEEPSRFQGANSHTSLSRSSASSLNNEQSQSTITPPTEVIPDWSGSSGTIPPILETW